ncbi:hypothetical protein CLOSYM_01527 [[Clostridium] symbiosum ATCC 14940]|uniref:Uncharacterized protein n=1 Tax=[Clostridium] symbiosum ATCC 14940 TaxID=411472 RepID=A0ABC9U013_CLOSY|nr:hypothetical protein CLOSYM_01527 [[Clostridium] symbiosum ATCC 14940]
MNPVNIIQQTSKYTVKFQNFTPISGYFRQIQANSAACFILQTSLNNSFSK